ncbi:type II toxin-antitoxin system VapC family toxin [Gloeobacter violaceus]|uniref:Ribonuclease VapC n=1 Tax=Gloeobacter violaceus (strain ATCC 29082 / PCC 7421) TaxID=251221 RepID=Q7NI02_GLOVI|nr:type II toxin-antitoxin system VapC family toxin [Gloeobacter violaceus]BAC90323.1 glr2382 [Gloeobacter violaceus PCC 7421]
MAYLLDTCVVSELIRPAPEARVLAFMEPLDPEACYLSALTVGELGRGIERMPASKRKETLKAWLHGQLLVTYADRIWPVDTDVAHCWAELSAALEAVGRTLPLFDSLIAATAVVHRAAIVTRNIQDFNAAGVSVVNPWDGYTLHPPTEI